MGTPMASRSLALRSRWVGEARAAHRPDPAPARTLARVCVCLTSAPSHAAFNNPSSSPLRLAYVQCNGQDFSHLVDVAGTTGLHGRTLDMPIEGLLAHGHGRVSILIHRDVVSAPRHAATDGGGACGRVSLSMPSLCFIPLMARGVDSRSHVLHHVSCFLRGGAQYEISTAARQQSRIIRREINAAALKRYAENVRPTLIGC
jgi:hypothetical protein